MSAGCVACHGYGGQSVGGAVDARDDVCVPPSVGRDIDERFGGKVLDAFKQLATFNEE